jgi:2,4-dienoyl-CoA reductase-like NADH-dependent reductase (Old Yellow Enzyme family)
MKLGPGALDWLLSKVLFGTPHEMTLDQIAETVAQFAGAAKLAYESGFKGVQIHAAHGFLLTQFLSPTSNKRTDAYGGTPEKRARIVVEVIRAVRAAVPASFCIGIKVNSADVGGAESLEESLQQIGLITNEAIDFIEISGGTMENLRMAKGDPSSSSQGPEKSERTLHREAFFLDYARAVRARYPDVLLMLTGGFRSRRGMQDALDSGACDMVGVGRPSVIWPRWAKEVLLNKEVEDGDARVDLEFVKPTGLAAWVPLKLVGLGADVVSEGELLQCRSELVANILQLYYANQILRLADGKETVAPRVRG